MFWLSSAPGAFNVSYVAFQLIMEMAHLSETRAPAVNSARPSRRPRDSLWFQAGGGVGGQRCRQTLPVVIRRRVGRSVTHRHPDHSGVTPAHTDLVFKKYLVQLLAWVNPVKEARKQKNTYRPPPLTERTELEQFWSKHKFLWATFHSLCWTWLSATTTPNHESNWLSYIHLCVFKGHIFVANILI